MTTATITILIGVIIWIGAVLFGAYTAHKESKEPKIIESKTDTPDKEKYKGCDIEYMPKTDRYYPRVNGDYLWRRYASGVLERSSSIAYCEFGRTKQEAIDMLDEYLETQGKGSQILEV